MMLLTKIIRLPLHAPLNFLSLPDPPPLLSGRPAAQIHVSDLILVIHELFQHVPAWRYVSFTQAQTQWRPTCR